MKISVEESTGNHFSLECKSTDTIAQLKEKVQEIKSTPPHEQMLFFHGKNLDDNFSENITLAYVGLRNESNIFLVHGPLRGGVKDLRSIMKIYVEELLSGKFFSLNCESTDTIAQLKEKVQQIRSIPPHEQMLYFRGKNLDDKFSEKTLAYVGLQAGSNVFLVHGGGGREWREEHAKVLLHLLLELCQDKTISEGNVTDQAWFRIKEGLKKSTNCSFRICFLKKRLDDYKQLYSLLADTSSPDFHWDSKNKIIRIYSDLWRERHPKLFLCGEYIPYFDILEEVCLLLNTGQSSEQQVSETSTNVNNDRLVDQDIP